MIMLLQVVQLFESWAHHLSPEQFATFGKPYAEQVLKGVKALHPETPVIYHANGGNQMQVSIFLRLSSPFLRLTTLITYSLLD